MKEKELYRAAVPFLNCKDYLVSNETYEVMLNQENEMLVTSPIPADLGKYYKSEDYQSHYNRKKTLLNFIYNTVKRRSFKRKESLFKSGNSPKSILDIGAGTGEFLLYCQNQNHIITGTEPNDEAREVARQNGIILHESIDEIVDQKYDVITMWHVLEHVPNLFDCLNQLKSMLKEDGKILIAVPNFKSYDAEYYKEYWAAYDVPRHLWHFSQKSIQNLFSSMNMNLVKTHPLKYDSFYVSLLSEKHKTGKSNYMKAFWVGFKSNMAASKTSEYSSLIYELEHA